MKFRRFIYLKPFFIHEQKLDGLFLAHSCSSLASSQERTFCIDQSEFRRVNSLPAGFYNATFRNIFMGAAWKTENIPRQDCFLYDSISTVRNGRYFPVPSRQT